MPASIDKLGDQIMVDLIEVIERSLKGEIIAFKAKFHDSAFPMPTTIYYGITLYK